MVKKGQTTERQKLFVQYYCHAGSETIGNAYQSAIKAGYAHNTANNADKLILGKNGVKELMKEYKAKTAVKLEHNRDIAISLLNEALTMARKQGNTSAIIAATRELNAISNLHSQTITQEVKEQPIPAAELDIIQDQTRIMNLKLAKRAV